MKIRELVNILIVGGVAALGTVGCAADDLGDEIVDDDAPSETAGDEKVGEEVGEAEALAESGEGDGETVGQTSQAAGASNAGAMFWSTKQTGNFTWTTMIRDTKRDGKSAILRVTITSPDSGKFRGVPNSRSYTQYASGYGTVTKHSEHIRPFVCVTSAKTAQMKISMKLYAGSKLVATRTSYGTMRCIP